MAQTNADARKPGEAIREFAGRRHRTVLTAGTADCERRMPFVLALESREDWRERRDVVVEELCRAIATEYIVFHLGIDAG